LIIRSSGLASRHFCNQRSSIEFVPAGSLRRSFREPGQAIHIVVGLSDDCHVAWSCHHGGRAA
jgi:hypothetical protein